MLTDVINCKALSTLYIWHKKDRLVQTIRSVKLIECTVFSGTASYSEQF